MPSSHLILCHPLLLLPPIPPSIRVFSNKSALCMKWPKYWSFSFNIIPSKEHPGLISFRMDWLDLIAVQGTLKSLLQHHSSKASILWCSAFFTVQLSHPYMTTGKTIALTRRTFVGKVMSLLLNMLSRLVITFLPRSKCLLISWLQSPSAVILEPKKIVWHCFHWDTSIYFEFSPNRCCNFYLATRWQHVTQGNNLNVTVIDNLFSIFCLKNCKTPNENKPWFRVPLCLCSLLLAEKALWAHCPQPALPPSCPAHTLPLSVRAEHLRFLHLQLKYQHSCWDPFD